ncbi:hypothetical protein HZP52_02445 [Elizabethkingia anophelis]|nr:hypothetical protein [Elizabethkingia anophelis]MCT4192851.1 hypothetical protein [Elizabethkingia anophelis]
MIKNIIFFATLIGVSLNGQIKLPEDIIFNKNAVDAENHWVIIKPKDTDTDKATLGFVYYDESGGGYSFRYGGELSYSNNEFQVLPLDNKGSMMITRIGNFSPFLAILPDQRLKDLKIDVVPSWLKGYSLNLSENEAKLRRASSLNGANRPDLALEILQKLYDKGYRTKDVYFELMFSYNALKQYTNASRIGKEAIAKGFSNNELIVKEAAYTAVHTEDWKTAEELAKLAFDFKNQKNKNEILYNLVYMYFSKGKYDEASKWIEISKNKMGGDTEKTFRNLDAIQAEIIKKK